MTGSDRALELIADGDVVGLGTGRAATEFVYALGEQVSQGLRVMGVPTSRETEELARRLDIPLTSLEDVECIDLTVDGADEVDPKGNLIKGYGGALLREKIVASASKQLLILVGPEKQVDELGERGRLPVEVVPFALEVCERRLRAMGLAGVPRMQDGSLFTTDNGNHIIDCGISVIKDPETLQSHLLAIPGLVETGLFLGMASRVLVDGLDTYQAASSSNP